MNKPFPESRLLRLHPGRALAAVVVAISCSLAAQQQPSASVDAQRAAMRKLAFLAGHWSGPVTMVLGPGEPLHLTQSEDVEYKLDGLVLLIEGKSVATDGKAQFEALATVAFDDVSHIYRFRAYNEGHYVDTELKVQHQGFSWELRAGPAQIVNTMSLIGKGEWQETTEVTVGNNPPRRTVDMLLQHQP